jgi:hypothetical protein
VATAPTIGATRNNIRIMTSDDQNSTSKGTRFDNIQEIKEDQQEFATNLNTNSTHANLEELKE